MAAFSLKSIFGGDSQDKTEHQPPQVNHNAVFSSLPFMFILTDGEGNILNMNEKAQSLISAKNAHAENLKVWEAIAFIHDYKASFDRAVANQQVEKVSQIPVAGSSGDTVNYMDVNFSPFTDDGKTFVSVFIEDVTVTVKKDEHLRQAQKMDSVGNLASGLAHDFNNVIGGIEGTFSSIKYSIDNASDLAALKSEITSDMEIIDESINHGKDIIQQLLSISRRKEMPFSPVDLNQVVNNVAKICANTFPRSVKIESTLFEGNAMLMGYPTQLEQMLLNLSVNACHAMTIMRKENERQGGTLSLFTEKIAVGHNLSAYIPEAVEGEYWMLTVGDSGVGIPREVLPKIFEPFFTTKDRDKGTGLGLAMVYNVVRQHKGFIDIFSELGQGTSFLIFLPVMKANA